jgi:DNA-binding response OmpR family regulator
MKCGRKHVLVLDGDRGILVAVKGALLSHEYEVTSATDGADALDLYLRSRPDLVLLDHLLPGVDGLEVCRQIRAIDGTPIIMLGIKDEEADIVAALDMGADDYLVKPFRLAELLARMRAVLRRGTLPMAEEIVCGELRLDTKQHAVTLADRRVKLSPTEYAVLVELARNAGRVLTTRMLLQRVWGGPYVDATGYVKAVVRRLRIKLEPDPNHPRYILTERYLGYRLHDPTTE